MCKLIEYFKEMQDYRQVWKIRHLLEDIIVIIICGVVSGAENISEIGLWSNCKEEWLKSILTLPHGIPSADTIERFVRYMNPKEFKRSFLHWVRNVARVTNGEIIPIDGKALRGSKDSGNKAIYMVSAWARTNGIVLGQEKVDSKSNEMKAIPELLKMLEIKGCIVTIDAMGCHKEIAEAVVKKEADYVLALKKNHKILYKRVETFFENCDRFKDCHCQSFEKGVYDSIIEEDKGHGRIETWHYYITNDLSQIESAKEWVNLKSIGMTISQREIKGVITRKIRYHLCSIEPDSIRYAEAVRGHWSIENSLHWVLDVVFREDAQRNRKDNSAENMAVIRHTALNLMKKDPSVKLSMKQMKKKLEWDHDYAMSLIFGDISP
jgi:predicted transposase YbfD/YdcC